MKAEEASKEAAAAADANKPVEKSPHAKEVSLFLLFFPRQFYHFVLIPTF
jgi:hypothetical protein